MRHFSAFCSIPQQSQLGDHRPKDGSRIGSTSVLCQRVSCGRLCTKTGSDPLPVAACICIVRMWLGSDPLLCKAHVVPDSSNSKPEHRCSQDSCLLNVAQHEFCKRPLAEGRLP